MILVMKAKNDFLWYHQRKIENDIYSNIQFGFPHNSLHWLCSTAAGA